MEPDRIALLVGIGTLPSFAAGIDASLRRGFADILTNLSSTYPSTPMIVLSSLSSDADIMAVEVARSLGVPVVACLPSSPREFESSFATPETRARFLDALATCRRVDIVRATTGADVSASATRYILHFSHVVVTVSDDGKEPVIRSGGEPEALTSRSDFETSLLRIDLCNRDLLRYGSRRTAGPTIEGLRLRAEAASDRLQRITFGFLYVLYAVAIAATAAQYLADQYVKYAMLLAAFGAYQLAKRFDFENRYQDYRTLSEGLRVQSAWMSAGLDDEEAARCYLGMQESELRWIRMALGFAYFAFRTATPGTDGSVHSSGCREWIDGQLSYFATAPRREERVLRRLRTGQRVAFWTALIASGSLVTWLYLSPMLESASERSDAVATSIHVPPGISTVLHGASHTFEEADLAWTAVKQSPWLAALGTWDTGGNGTPSHHASLVRWSTAALALYAAIALLISNYAEKRSFAQNVRRYDRMWVVFERARKRLDAMPNQNSEAGRDVIRELGRAALIEHADWLLTRRDRPLAFVS